MPSRNPLRGIVRFFVAAGLFFGTGFGAAWLYDTYIKPPVKQAQAPVKNAVAPKPDADVPALAPPAADMAAPSSPAKRLAVIIDDIGLRREPVEKLLALDLSITFAVLPGQPHTEELAALIAEAGREVMLHLPMEPENEELHDPGKGALLVTQPDEDIRAAIARALEQVRQAKGVNNHMGSLFTRDERKMGTVLEELRKRGLFFVDSLTTPASVAYRTARAMGLRTAQRRVFLDNDENEEAIAHHIRLAVEIAVKEGSAVAIGHPYPATVAALAQLKDECDKAGVTLVYASQAVR